MIAWGALIIWPAIVAMLYKRQSLAMATSLTIFGGYLLLPVGLGLNLPKIPTLDRTTISTIAAVVMTAFVLSERGRKQDALPGWVPRSIVVRTLLFMVFVGILGTVLTNRDVLVYGYRTLSGHSLYDAGSMAMEAALVVGPLLLGRKVLSSRAAQLVFLKVFVVVALGYSLLALYEVRMSPQLHSQLYGYFPSDFAQQMRASGFRPVVFLGHGLAVSLFFAMATLAAAGLFRATSGEGRWKWLAAVGWLFMTLVLSKSLGALMITSLLLPTILFFSARMQLIMALCIATSFMSYPVLRSTNLVPIEQVVEFAGSIGATRATSFLVRVENEERLLEKALQRPLFGWGGWGRPRVYTEYGFNISITDGSWIIELGTGGWVRYIAVFGLLSWPVFGLFFRRRDKVDYVNVCVVLLISAKLIDLVPNSVIGPLAWLMAGSVIGRLERPERDSSPVEQEARNDGLMPRDTKPVAQPPVYARTFTKNKSRPAQEYGPRTPETKATGRAGSYQRLKSTGTYRK